MSSVDWSRRGRPTTPTTRSCRRARAARPRRRPRSRLARPLRRHLRQPAARRRAQPSARRSTPTVVATVTACPIQFTDVLPADPFYTYIRCLACRNIISAATRPARPAPRGQTPCYNGGANVTRGQVAKIVANAAGYADPIPSTQQTFTDVPYTNPFWVYIERLAEPGRQLHQRLLDQPALHHRHALLPAVQQRDPRADGEDRRQRGRLLRRHPLDAADLHRCAATATRSGCTSSGRRCTG